MIHSLVSSLLEHGKIKTTVHRAKEASRNMEKLVTLAKKNDLASYRLAIARLRGNELLAKKLFQEIAPKMKERAGGYTRVIKLGPRPGDNAETALLEFVL